LGDFASWCAFVSGVRLPQFGAATTATTESVGQKGDASADKTQGAKWDISPPLSPFCLQRLDPKR